MSSLIELLPWLVAMAVLTALSAFFSASEAALFYLRPGERRLMEHGNARERAAFRLLKDPDRLLSAVLFCNLVINIIYFALSSVVALRIEENPDLGSVPAVAFAFGSLIMIIFCSEMLPKSLAVIRPMSIASLVSMPLSCAVRLTDPIMPLLRSMTKISRRLIWPGFKPEPYMELADLERAIHISSEDRSIVQQEQTVLNNIVKLGDIRVDEWMRPRTQFRVFDPPVSLEVLKGTVTRSGYLLVNGAESGEIETALRLDSLTNQKNESIERLAQSVTHLPWTATVADALEQMSNEQCQVTSIVNEFGETIGILTIEDVFETVFSFEPSRSKRLLDLNPIHRISKNRWAVSGMMSLKRLAKKFHVTDLPTTRSVTVAGAIQELKQRMVQVGDQCTWGPFEFRVVEVPQVDNILVELRLSSPRPYSEIPNTSEETLEPRNEDPGGTP